MQTQEPSAHPVAGDAPEARSAAPVPPVVAEEERLLELVLSRLDRAPEPRPEQRVDDAATLIELRDALAEAKPEDQASLLEQMHRVEALSKQRGKGKSAPIDRRSPYFGHLRLEENGKRRDVLIGQRGFVEPGGGVQIVDWRNAPVSRLFYRYDEGDAYEEQLGNRLVEGEVLARRTVTILDSKLRRVACQQGTFARDAATGGWREIDTRTARLRVERDGSKAELAGTWPAAADAPAAHGAQPRGRLGVDGGSERRGDRFLPAIAALIDPRQFELISRPTSGLIVVQGSAGSGKTTIGLHRIAYLAFADPRRFRPERMLVVVYQRALATYVSRVLPALDVPGVRVLTFADWARQVRAEVLPTLDAPLCEHTPSLVVRVKAHGALLHILEDRQRELAAVCRARIAGHLAADPALCAQALDAWDRAAPVSALQGAHVPVDARTTALARWVQQAQLAPAVRTQLEALGRELRTRTRDVVGEWADLLTSRTALREGFARHAPGAFTDSQLDAVHAWCVERERLRLAAEGDAGSAAPPRRPAARREDDGTRADLASALGQSSASARPDPDDRAPRGEDHDLEAADAADDETDAAVDGGQDESFALDAEDDALLLRIHQLQRGPLASKAGPIQYEHLMVDEVQDFAPIELAVLLDSTTSARSITLAGDTAQAIAPEHGFSRWSDMLDDLGIPHDKVEPLRVSYRSTREIVDCAEHVLGPLAGDVRPVAPRSGAPVEAFGFGAPGEAAEFLGQALKELLREEPGASVAVIARHPEQARLYFDVLKQADVPRLRLVSEQDFSFSPGIDVTDVRQTKGLEFDIVILLEATAESYPVSDHSRRLLHVAMTRAAHQLWVTYTGTPSPLLPDALRQ